jgi:hypothetical protein
LLNEGTSSRSHQHLLYRPRCLQYSSVQHRPTPHSAPPVCLCLHTALTSPSHARTACGSQPNTSLCLLAVKSHLHQVCVAITCFHIFQRTFLSLPPPRCLSTIEQIASHIIKYSFAWVCEFMAIRGEKCNLEPHLGPLRSWRNINEDRTIKADVLPCLGTAQLHRPLWYRIECVFRSTVEVCRWHHAPSVQARGMHGTRSGVQSKACCW